MFHPTLNPAPAPKMYCLLTAITAMALAARIHNTDIAVMTTGYRLLPRIKPQYRDIILDIINSPTPLRHMNAFVIRLPATILEQKITQPVLPLLDAG